MSTSAATPLSKTALNRFLAEMPKAELHMHIEGSLEPEMIFKLAQRNGLTLAYRDVAALKKAYQFTDLQSFLDVFFAGNSVLLTADDFYDMAMAYFERAAADNVVHAELFFDAQAHTARGVAFKTIMDGLIRAQVQAQATLQLSSGLILCFLRHLSEQEAFECLAQALPWREHLLGVGLDSSEIDHPPEKFARVFDYAVSLGLQRVAHAGEEGPPEYIRQALSVLKVARIDHGVQAIRDPALVAELAQSQTPLTVCPISNVKLCVFPDMASHVLPQLLDAGVCVTVNSDDPAYFGGYINDNFLALFDAHPNLTARHAYLLAQNSFEASFCDADKKAQWQLALDEAWQRCFD